MENSNLKTKTSVELGLDNNPFTPKSKVMRTPPQQFGTPSADAATFAARTNFVKLGDKITKLVEFLKSKNNIHREIVSMTREIHALYMLAKDEPSHKTCVSDDVKSMEAKETQTERQDPPRVLPTSAKKRSATVMSPKDLGPKKKKRSTSPRTERCVQPISREERVSEADSVKPVSQNPWQTAKKKGKIKKRAARPDAIVIKACSEVSYADILKKVKRDAKLHTLGENVKGIRKTEKGELIVELCRPEHEKLLQFKDAVQEVLGGDAEVRSVTHEIIIDIRDIDEVTTKEEVAEALEIFLGKSLQMSDVKSLRRSYGGTQIATVGLNAPLANKLIEAGKIRIGWVVCRVRQKISPRRCFKCLDFGHIAANCKSTNDYTNCCIKCGERGHKIKDCTNNAKCLLCSKTNEDSRHVTGSAACPRFKKAVEAIRRRA